MVAVTERSAAGTLGALCDSSTNQQVQALQSPATPGQVWPGAEISIRSPNEHVSA